MPIYEFYCPDCNVLFSFFSKRVNTAAEPQCPRCKRRKLQRQVSLFSTYRRLDRSGVNSEDSPDGGALERAAESLVSDPSLLNDDDPRSAARLMRVLGEKAGIRFGPATQEAISRIESGERPDEIEAELGDRLQDEEPSIDSGSAGRTRSGHRSEPARDETLYEL